MHLAGALHALGWRSARGVPASRVARGGGAAARRAGHVVGAAPDPTPGTPPDPVVRLARAGRQQDRTTCGSAVLTMLAARGDPGLTQWLATGRLPAGSRPPELRDAPPSVLAALRAAPPEARFAAVHCVVKDRTSRAGVPWPAALGTSPWGAARVARFPGLRWGHHPLGGAASVRAHLDAVGPWVAAGVPVPLFTGGDTAHRWASAVPRHVVLLVGREADTWQVWEPARGAVLRATTAGLADGAAPHPALGGWSRTVWAMVPWRSDADGARMVATVPE